jgi:hypothetical protein
LFTSTSDWVKKRKIWASRLLLHVVGQRHLFRQPVDALLGQPGLVGPGIAERLVDVVGGEQGQ